VHPGGIRTNIARDARAPENSTSQQRANDFSRIARTTPEQAAKTILRGVERKRARILIGPDAYVFDAAPRLLGSGYQRLSTVAMTVARRFGVSIGGI
jgi:hypothetical protein